MANQENDDIKKAVKDAVGGLGDLLRSANDAVEKAKKNMDRKNAAPSSNIKPKTESNAYKNTKFKPPQLYKKTDGEESKGKARTVVGISFFLAGLLAVAGGLIGLFSGGAFRLGLTLPGSFMTVIGVALTSSGIKKFSLAKSFKQYLRILDDKTYVTVGRLVEESGKSEEKVEKELTKLIAQNYFRQGHLDRARDYFITSDETYRNYEEVLVLQERLQAVEREEENALRESGLSKEGIHLVKKGEEFLSSLNRLNAEIPDPVMTEKLQRLEESIRRILTEVRKMPESAGELRKLMNYYLPTTEKLVRSYEELETREETAEREKMKAEIVTTLDTMNSAIEKIQDKLFLNAQWDVAADISVLNKVLEMEGLKEEVVR